MDVDLYADPSCPWSWAAYLWLDQVAPRRQLRVRVQPFSLAIRDGTAHLPDRLRLLRTQAHGALRVASVIDAGDARNAFYATVSASMYAAFARGHVPEVDIAAALIQARLDPGLAARAGDSATDEGIERAMASLADVLPRHDGTTQRIPVIVLHGQNGRFACEGPLLDPPPRGRDALQLWDATEQLLQLPGVYGISRPRPEKHSLIAAKTG